MKSIVKLILLILILAGFIFLTSYVFIDFLLMQIVFLCISLLISSITLPLKNILSEIKLMFPFVTTMMLIYLLLGIIGFRINQDIPQTQLLRFWIHYGLCRTMLLMSNMFFIQFIISLFSINDVFSLPMSIYKKKYLLLGRALFVYAVKNLTELESHLRLMPEYQTKKMTFKKWFFFKLQITMALIIMVLRESQIKGELIDNRIKHCFADANKERI